MIGSIDALNGAGNGFIDISAADLERVRKKLAELPEGAGGAGTEAATNYLLGVMENKAIPDSMSVFHGSRKMAYGAPFFTAKQRRFFFAALADGRIQQPYRRGGKSSGMQSEWRTTGSGLSYRIYNRSRAAFFAYDNDYQARQLGLAGWPKVGEVVTEYLPNIVQSFMRGVRTWLKKEGLK